MKVVISKSVLLISMFFGLVLTGCGGGDGGGSNYVTWSGNANGTYIVDWNNEFFVVNATTRQVERENGVVLLSTFVDTNGNFYSNNAWIGYVGYAASTTGSTIAMFRCSDSVRMNIFTTSGGGWSYEC
ncbi:MAG: hypothetical protein RL018_1205 [Pseudomonadota bacterium]